MGKEAMEKMLLEIYFVDKTPLYEYEGENSLTTEGYKSFRGSRWCTPREIIRDYFSGDFWEKYNKHCARGKKERSKR